MDKIPLGLRIEIIENGFVVYEGGKSGVIARIWAFETALSLTQFVESWGHSVKALDNKGDEA